LLLVVYWPQLRHIIHMGEHYVICKLFTDYFRQTASSLDSQSFYDGNYTVQLDDIIPALHIVEKILKKN
jgi:hypothetical protein